MKLARALDVQFGLADRPECIDSLLREAEVRACVRGLQGQQLGASMSQEGVATFRPRLGYVRYAVERIDLCYSASFNGTIFSCALR